MVSYNKNIITYYLIQRFYNKIRRGSYMTEGYKVKLDAFEGPLDLLLHLINQYEIDIHDIPVSQITEQYMHYIHTMQHLELNIASEYLVMASTLVAIKSEMRSEERRVGKECRTRWWEEQGKKKKVDMR